MAVKRGDAVEGLQLAAGGGELGRDRVRVAQRVAGGAFVLWVAHGPGRPPHPEAG